MFDLEFHATVSRMMEWTKDAPPSKFLTFHQSIMEERNSTPNKFDVENTVLRAYIIHDYPRYFETRISIGKKTAKNFDKIMHKLQ